MARKSDIDKETDGSLSIERDLIDALVEKYKKEGSSATATFLWESSTAVKEWISTGSIVLDTVISNTKNGGVPVGRLTEISGLEGCGKSLLASYILANTQKMGGVAVLIDTEHAASMEVLSAVGVDVQKLVYVQAGSVEDVFRAFDQIVEKIQLKGRDRLITIVWDSVAATSTLAEVEGDFDGNTMGLAARRIGQGLRKLIPIISTHRVCCVFLNQLRTKIGVSFGDNMGTPGGMAIPFHSSVRLRLNHYQQIKDQKSGDMTGKVIRCQVKKNKVAPPMREVLFQIRWGSRLGAWIDESETLLAMLEKLQCVTKKTAQTYVLTVPETGKEYSFTKRQWVDLIEDKDFYDVVKSVLYSKLIITKDNLSPDVVIERDEEAEE